MDKIYKNLIVKAINKDKNALETLIKREKNNIIKTIYYLKKDYRDIMDITQNVLLKVSRKIYQLKEPESFKIWLNHIIVNTYYDYLRKTKKENDFQLLNSNTENIFDIPDNSANPQDNILNMELEEKIKNSVKKLPQHYKIPIILREFKGMSYEKISAITKSDLGTTKSRIARARTLIKNDLKNYTKDV